MRSKRKFIQIPLDAGMPVIRMTICERWGCYMLVGIFADFGPRPDHRSLSAAGAGLSDTAALGQSAAGHSVVVFRFRQGFRRV
jgi:hypothetical protein